MVELKPGAKVSFRGVCNYSVETAKNGSHFVKGTIKDRKDVIAFKIWDATSLSVDLLKVVKITGLVKEYNKEVYIEATDVVNDGDDILSFVEACPIDTGTMLEDLRNIARMCSKEWSDKLLEVLSEQEGILLVANMPNTTHSERGGFLSHIHEAAYSATSEMNRIERLGISLNRDILIPGIILAKIYNFESFTFDPVTGEASSEKTSASVVFGRAGSFLKSYEISRGLPFENEVVNLVGAVNYIIDPVTPEAMIARETYYTELASYEAVKLANNTKVGETIKGNKYTFIGTASSFE